MLRIRKKEGERASRVSQSVPRERLSRIVILKWSVDVARSEKVAAAAAGVRFRAFCGERRGRGMNAFPKTPFKNKKKSSASFKPLLTVRPRSEEPLYAG